LQGVKNTEKQEGCNKDRDPKKGGGVLMKKVNIVFLGAGSGGRKNLGGLKNLQVKDQGAPQGGIPLF